MGETQKLSLSRFVMAAVVWALMGGALGFKYNDNAERFFYWKCFGVFVVLCSMNLFFLGKTVASLLRFVSDNSDENKQERPSKGKEEHLVPLFIWGSAKFLSLGGIIASLVLIENPPSMSLYFGIGTMVAVPLLGGAIMALKTHDAKS